MGLYAPTFATRVGDLEYFARDVRTGEETPIEVETAGTSSAPPADQIIANLRAQVRDLQSRTGTTPAAAQGGATPAAVGRQPMWHDGARTDEQIRAANDRLFGRMGAAPPAASAPSQDDVQARNDRFYAGRRPAAS